MNKIFELALDFISKNYNIVKNDWVYIIFTSLVIGGIAFSIVKFLYKESLDEVTRLKNLIKERCEILTEDLDKQSEILFNNKELIESKNNEINKLYEKYREISNEFANKKQKTKDIISIFQDIKKLHKAQILLENMGTLKSKMNEQQFLILLSDLKSINTLKSYILEELFEENSQSLDRYKVYYEKILPLEEILQNNITFIEKNENDMIFDSSINNSVEISSLLHNIIEMEEKYYNIQK